MSDQASSFGSVADDYLRARSEYPREMFDRIFDSGQLRAGSLILDIGCGSGQASLEFARRGSTVVALDPAKSALDLLAQRCGELAGIELVHSSFEEYKESRRFDLIACGQAFHWLDLDAAPGEFAKLLNAGGRIACFWHLQDVEPNTPQAELYVLSSKYYKSFPVMNPPEYGREFIDAMADCIEKSGCFTEVQIHEYPWQQCYEPEMFKALFRSASNYARLEPALQNQIATELDEYLSGLSADPIISYRTCLIEAAVGGT